MSLFDTLRKLVAPAADTPAPLHHLPGEAGQVLALLRAVNDPELGVNVVDLGLVRGLHLEGDQVEVELVLTTAGCPMAGPIAEEMEAVLLEAGYAPMVRVVEGRWTPADISPAGRAWMDADGPGAG
jgi:metal-sulfur cluster biosynthetic enzyme